MPKTHVRVLDLAECLVGGEEFLEATVSLSVVQLVQLLCVTGPNAILVLILQLHDLSSCTWEVETGGIDKKQETSDASDDSNEWREGHEAIKRRGTEGCLRICMRKRTVIRYNSHLTTKYPQYS